MPVPGVHDHPPEVDGLVARVVELADENAARGQRPYAALVVRWGEVIATGTNTTLRDGDPTAHAEVEAIRAACTSTGSRTLDGAVLVSSCHPCEMCQAVTRLARIDEIIHAGPCASNRRVPLPELTVTLVSHPDVAAPFTRFVSTGHPLLDEPV